MILKKFFRFLVFSNIFVAISAACSCATTLLLIGSSILETILPSSFVLLSTYFVYNFQRIWRINHRHQSENHRLNWIHNNRTALIWSLIIVIFPLVYLSTNFNVYELLILAFCTLIAIGYVLPVIKLNSQWRMLREIPYIKIFIVALIWTSTTVYLPYFMIHNDWQDSISSLNFLALDRFCFIFAITLPFDIRDLKYDRNENLKTMAMKIGVKGTKVLSMTIISLLILLHILAQINLSVLRNEGHLGMITSYLLVSFVLVLIHEKRKELFYSGLIESTIIVQLILILLFTSI